MATDPILDAKRIERKPVPKHERTDDRDEAARWIQDMWPASCTEIAEASSYSRQHISKVLKLYFRETGDGESSEETAAAPETDQTPISSASVTLDVMKLAQIYRMGYRQGREDAKRELRGEPIDDVDPELATLMGVTNE